MSIHSLDEIAAKRNGPTVLARLRWIDDRLQWQGGFRRRDLMDRFSISPQQASGDISTYQSLAPENATIDPSTKGYLRQSCFAPLFPKDFMTWLREEGQAGPGVLPTETLTLPSRHLDEGILSSVVTSYTTRTALSIQYQSLTSSVPSERTICVHHLVDTGDRLHLRAWDDKRSTFADFIVGRITKADLRSDYPWVDGVADVSWNQHVDVILGPDDGLSKSQRTAIERDFGMSRGRVAVSCRKAMVVYLLGRLGLLDAVRAADGRAAFGVTCLNPAELQSLLPDR